MNLSSVMSIHMLLGSLTLYLAISLGQAIPLLEMGMMLPFYRVKVKVSLNTVYAIRPQGLAIALGLSCAELLYMEVFRYMSRL